MIKTALVAYGFSATTFHVPFLMADPKFELTAIVTSKVKAVETMHESINVVASIEELDCKDLDLVIITSPNQFHFEQAAYFLKRGCHVVVEKPFVLSSEHAIALASLATEHQKQLVVFQNRRWDGDFLTIKSLIETQRIGELKRLTSRFDRFRPMVRDRWREQATPGGGILWDLGPHLLDQVVDLFGMPKTLQSNVSALRTNAVVDDNFELWLDYGDFQVNLGSSSFQAGPNARFLLEGTKGTFVKYGLDPQEHDLKLGIDVLDDRWGQESDESWGILYQEDRSTIITTKPGNYGAFWHQLALAIENGQESPVPVLESLCVIQLLELAFESQAQGRKLAVE